jgi:osmoprotectant transport system ATP-binding protein
VVKKLGLYQVADLAAPVGCVVRERELAHVGRLMQDKGAEIAFLIDDNGRACGFLTAGDIDGKGESISPQSLMQMALARRGAFAQRDLVLRDALSLMLEHGVEHLGVLNGAELVGVITLSAIRKHSCRKEGE